MSLAQWKASQQISSRTRLHQRARIRTLLDLNTWPLTREPVSKTIDETMYGTCKQLSDHPLVVRTSRP
eukprot:9005100-Alexandrium_andersonii.AAC.1